MNATIKNRSKNKLHDIITSMKGRSCSFVFSGARGTGKSCSVKELACKLLDIKDLNTHPNILWIDTEQKNVSVVEIRNISNFMFRTSCHPNLPKLIVIDCADNLNIHSLNALLKVLEEPTKNTYFIMISHNADALPDTIKSRCIIINFPPPSLSSTRQLLKRQLPDLSETQLNDYLSLSSSPGILMQLIKNDTLKVYKELLELLQNSGELSNKLYGFIEKNFSKSDRLETFQFLVKTLIYKAIRTKASQPPALISEEKKAVETITATKSMKKLLAINDEIDSFVADSKLLGLDTKGVILIVLHKLMR